METKISFKENLKELLINSNLSQAKLAKEIDVSQRAVSKWLIGQAEPTATNIFKLAMFFDVSSDFLLGLKDE
ncbi:MAG: helix-turn-helix transcriptional regulator [Clostridia bacterium]|nr:helix-turn-helix transcriptional regulator [Clostridia bacterium]